MNRVEPIRDQKKIDDIKTYLKNWNDKYYMMWLLGTNIGLRVSDIIKIKAGDIAGKDHLIFRDKKTNKEHRLPINRHLRREIADYIEKMQFDKDDYIIPSQKGINRPLSRSQAYYVLKATAVACGINEPIGTHTMRKTFGYWHYRQHRDVALLQQIFRHASPAITLRYIGINDDIIEKSLEDFLSRNLIELNSHRLFCAVILAYQNQIAKKQLHIANSTAGYAEKNSLAAPRKTVNSYAMKAYIDMSRHMIGLLV